MSRIRSSLLGAALLASLALPLSASAALKVTGTPKVSFFAEGTVGALDIEGKTNSLTLTDDGTKLVFSVPMNTVKTAIDTRDGHMLEAIEATKFPNAILTVEKAGVQWGANAGEKKSGKVQGVFNAHGVDQPVTVTYTTTKTATGFTLNGKFNFNTAKAKIGEVSYLGVGVDENMRAEVTVDVIDG
jgi:polyisoprenoid-binding protein YceI